MMRKVISMSALVAAGLMGTPLMAAMPARAWREGADAPVVMSPETALAERMQELHERLAAEMQRHLVEALALARVGAFRMEFAENIGPWPGAGSGLMVVAPARMEKGAYLGVATLPVSGELRDQLKLPEGMGLVVEYVEPGSPADKAGVKVHDVLEKMDDQLLVNAQQFVVLVRDKKPGDTVRLGIIRGGERQSLKATLTERELPALESEEGAGRFYSMPQAGVVPGFPVAGGEGWQHGVRRTVEGHADGSVTRRLEDGEHDITIQTTKEGVSTVVVKDAQGHEVYSGPYTTDEEKARVPGEVASLVKSLAETGHIGPGEIGTTTAATITRVDADQQITMKVSKAGKTLVVKDVKTGKVIYDGPADTEEELKGLPAEVREKVKALEEKVRVK